RGLRRRAGGWHGRAMRPVQHLKIFTTVLLAAGCVVVGSSGCALLPVGEADQEAAPEGALEPVAEEAVTADESSPDQEAAGEDAFEAHLVMVETPPEMERDDDVGAQAAAEYFMYAYTYAYGTADTGPLEQMSGTECNFCASAVAGVEAAHTDGDYMRAGDPLILGMAAAPSDEPEVDFLVRIDVLLPEMRTFDAEHNIAQIHPAGEVEAGLAMARQGEQWWVVGAVFDAADAA